MSNRQYEECIKLAMCDFIDQFQDRIERLRSSFPPEYIIENTERAFWGGSKVLPEPIYLNLENPTHLCYIQTTSNIYAIILRIPFERNSEIFA